MCQFFETMKMSRPDFYTYQCTGHIKHTYWLKYPGVEKQIQQNFSEEKLVCLFDKISSIFQEKAEGLKNLLCFEIPNIWLLLYYLLFWAGDLNPEIGIVESQLKEY